MQISQLANDLAMLACPICLTREKRDIVSPISRHIKSTTSRDPSNTQAPSHHQHICTTETDQASITHTINMFSDIKTRSILSALLLGAGITEARTITFYARELCEPGLTQAIPNAGQAICYSPPNGLGAGPLSVTFSGMAPYEIGLAYQPSSTIPNCGSIIDSGVGLAACVDAGTAFSITGAKIVSCNSNVMGMIGQLCGLSKEKRGLEGASAADAVVADQQEDCPSGTEDADLKMRIGGHWFRKDKNVPANVTQTMDEMWAAGKDVAYEDIPEHVLEFEDFEYVHEE